MPTATGTSQTAASPAAVPETPDATPVATTDPFPQPACPGPDQAAAPPEILAHVDGGPAITATSGSSTTMTCSTTGVTDVVGRSPDTPLLADPGDVITLTVPAGWAFTRWEGFDAPVQGEGANVWPPTTVAGRPRSIDVPVPLRSGDSILGLTVVLISDDERTVVEQALELLVRVG